MTGENKNEEFRLWADSWMEEIHEELQKLKEEFPEPIREEFIPGNLTETARDVAIDFYTHHHIQKGIKDGSLTVYEEPTDEQLKAVLTEAENYNGTWYHSVVHLNFDETVWSELHQEIAALPKTAGVYRVYVQHDPELEEQLFGDNRSEAINTSDLDSLT